MANTEEEMQLLDAFQNFTNSLSKRMEERDQRRESLLELKQLIKQKRDELLRLDEEIKELRGVAGNGGDRLGIEEEEENELSKEEKKLAAAELRANYWKGIYKTLRLCLHIKFSCGDPEEPNKVTLGFLLDKKGLAKKTVIITEDPPLEQVEKVWEDLKNMQEPKVPKKKFVERCVQDLTLFVETNDVPQHNQ